MLPFLEKVLEVYVQGVLSGNKKVCSHACAGFHKFVKKTRTTLGLNVSMASKIVEALADCTVVRYTFVEDNGPDISEPGLPASKLQLQQMVESTEQHHVFE